MTTALDISQVRRRTGLSSRALRFCEAKGLLKPLRTGSGRLLYGPGGLSRLNHITALKRAGFSLAQIGGLLAGRAPNLTTLVEAQF